MKKKKNLNQYKLKKINQLKNKYNYFYIFRISNMNFKDIRKLKKVLLKKNLNFYFLKQKITSFELSNLKSQGPLVLVCSNNIVPFKIFSSISELNFVYFYDKNKIYSNLNLQNINKTNSSYEKLNFILKSLIIQFYFITNKITKN